MKNDYVKDALAEIASGLTSAHSSQNPNAAYGAVYHKISKLRESEFRNDIQVTLFNELKSYFMHSNNIEIGNAVASALSMDEIEIANAIKVAETLQAEYLKNDGLMP